MEISAPKIYTPPPLSAFQNAFITRYNDLVKEIDGRLQSTMEIIKVLDLMMENEKVYSQTANRALLKMPEHLLNDDASIQRIWNEFRVWSQKLATASTSTYNSIKLIKEDVERCYTSFEQEKKKVNKNTTMSITKYNMLHLYYKLSICFVFFCIVFICCYKLSKRTWVSSKEA